MILRNARVGSGLLLVATMLSTLTVRADEPRRCAAMEDDRARLDCYDAIFGRPAAPAPGGATTVAVPATVETAAAQAAAAPSPEADFGLSEVAKRARDPAQSQAQFPESISGVVAAVSRQPAGELIVTLANGQVWTQVHVDERARVAAGDTVTIKKAALGSHLLVTANRYATRVRRVK